MFKRILALLMALAVLFVCSGCGGEPEPEPEPEKEAQTEEPAETEASKADPLFEITGQLYGTGFEMLSLVNTSTDKNRLVSPFSLMAALGMTANGAESETLKQIEDVMGSDADRVNKAFSEYEPAEGFKSANSFWLKDEYAFNPSYKQTLEEDYKAHVETLPFDAAAAEKINSWVDGATDGMIKKLVSGFSESQVDVIINACAFDGKWAEPFPDPAQESFLNEDGSVSNVNMLSGTAESYFEGEGYSGFIKDYEEGYAFVGLRPEGSVAEFLAAHSGADIMEMVKDTHSDADVEVKIPELEESYSADLSQILRDMGMPLAFSPAAEFPKIIEQGDKISISQALQKNYIKLDKEGTKAAASTEVTMDLSTALPEEKEVRQIYLDKAFIYLIVDKTGRAPLFAGVVNKL